ncbi:hypothetical protein RUND412_007707 [Rhizina undulata]
MQFLGFITALAATAFSTVNAANTTLSYNSVYNNASESTLLTACSNGVNGLYTKGYETLGDIPSFPYVGAAFTIEDWNSTSCGTCYQITYNGISINMTAVDVSMAGFVLSKTALDLLTDGEAAEWGRIEGQWEQVDASVCGL